MKSIIVLQHTNRCLAQLRQNKIFVEVRIQSQAQDLHFLAICTCLVHIKLNIYQFLGCVVQGFVLGLNDLYRIFKIFQDTLDSISEKHLSQFGRLYFHQGSELKYRILSYLLGLDEQQHYNDKHCNKYNNDIKIMFYDNVFINEESIKMNKN